MYDGVVIGAGILPLGPSAVTSLLPDSSSPDWLCTVLECVSWIQFYNDYGDIIKATLGKAREINKVHTAKTLAASLTQLYRELQEEQHVVDHSSESFLSIKVVKQLCS